MFEENDDGRHRARVTTNTLYYDDDAAASHAEHLAVNTHGDLVAQTVSSGDPYHGHPVSPSRGSDGGDFQFTGHEWQPLQLCDTTVL